MNQPITPKPAPLRQKPAPGLVVLSCGWAAVFGAVSMHTTGTVRLAAFLLAAWPPLLALLATLRPIDAKPHWIRMGTGVGLFVVAATVEAVLRFAGLAEPSEETVADLIYLAGYMLIASGVLSLVRRHCRDDIRAGLIDGTVMLLPAAVLLAEFVLHDPTQSDGAPWPLRLLAACYPLLDVVLLAALVWLAATPTLTRAHLGLLTTGMGLNLLANMAIAVEVMTPNEAMNRVVEGVFPLAWTLLAAGVATGAAVRYGRQRHSEVVHWGRVGLLGFGAILGPLTIVIAAMPPEPLEVIWVSIAVVISSSWIVWRMMSLARFLGVTTNQLTRARQELQVQATHDPLTGLLNRAVLDDVLGDLERPEARPAALLSIDLDLFKSVNDTYGHAAGDRVLTSTADRLRSVVRPSDLVLRMGGDEFLVVMERITAPEAGKLAARIVRTVEEPIHDGDQWLRIACSVGIAMVEGDPESTPAAGSVARADAAMYRAKRADTGASGAVAQAPGPDKGPGHADTTDAGPGSVVVDDEPNRRTGTGEVDSKR